MIFLLTIYPAVFKMCAKIFQQLLVTLKVPERENIVLAFFTLSDPIWVGIAWGLKPKKWIFCIILFLISMDCDFFTAC